MKTLHILFAATLGLAPALSAIEPGLPQAEAGLCVGRPAVPGAPVQGYWRNTCTFDGQAIVLPNTPAGLYFPGETSGTGVVQTFDVKSMPPRYTITILGWGIVEFFPRSYDAQAQIRESSPSQHQTPVSVVITADSGH